MTFIYLLVGQELPAVPVASTLQIAITPHPQAGLRPFLRPPMCSATPNWSHSRVPYSYQMPYGDVVRVGGGCVNEWARGLYFVRGVAVRRIGAQGAHLFSTY